MTERLQQPSDSGHRSARRRPHAGALWGARKIPALPNLDAPAETGPTILGFPAEVPEETEGAESPPADDGPDVLPFHRAPGVLKRVDRFGAAALVLAGVAANMSLLLSWSPGDGPTGLALVQHSVEALRFGAGDPADTGLWQPLVVVVSGGLLVVLGLLLLIPARAHRFVGVVALIVSLAAAAAVILLMADTGWSVDRFGPGLWCAAAVPVLGLLGSLKTLVSAPLVALVPVEQQPPATGEAAP
jgi:hypothetical protein